MPPIHLRLAGRRQNHDGLCRDVCAKSGKPVSILPAALYEDACRKLGILGPDRRIVFPSTGFLAILAELGNPQSDDAIHLFGFSFQGWKRHKWTEERAFVLSVNGRRLVYRAPAAGLASDS